MTNQFSWEDFFKQKSVQWAILLAIMTPWLLMTFAQPVHQDMLWLCLAMERILSGQTMSQSAYETNPPLSMLIYVIPAALHKYTGLSLQISTLTQSFLLLFLCAAMLRQTLKNFTHISEQQRSFTIYGFICGSTIWSLIFFGERDHYIGMFLPAFILIQLSITNRINTHKRFIWPFLLLGSLLILTKPHHGLIPTLMILHRAYKTRSLSFLKDPDFISLALLTLLYVPMTMIFFKDYTDIILPDVIKYYYPLVLPEPLLLILLPCAALIACVYFISLEFLSKSSIRNFVMIMIGCGTLSLIPVIVQAKGFYYHFLPMLIFVATGISLTVSEGLHKFKIPSKATIPVTLLALGLITYFFQPLNFSFKNYMGAQKSYEKVYAVINERNAGKENKSFWIYYNGMDLSQQAHYHTGAEFGSRFASPWFLYTLWHELNNPERAPTPDGEPTPEQELQRFSGMVAEDLNHYKPNVAIILAPEFFAKKYDQSFDYIQFLSANPEFAKAWKPYHKKDKIEFTTHSYFGKLDDPQSDYYFDVYERADVSSSLTEDNKSGHSVAP